MTWAADGDHQPRTRILAPSRRAPPQGLGRDIAITAFDAAACAARGHAPTQWNHAAAPRRRRRRGRQRTRTSAHARRPQARRPGLSLGRL